MAWEKVAAVGLKPPPREQVMTAGQLAGSGRTEWGLTAQPSSEADGPADGVDEVETRTCQAPVGVVSVAIAGRMSSRGLTMLGESGVMLLVLMDWVAGPFVIGSWCGMTWNRFTAVGLKPPPRERVMATGRLTAGVGK